MTAIRQVQAAVAARYGISVAEMIGPCRDRRHFIPRAIAIRLVRELTGASFQKIGRAFGGRHHTTIYHAISKPLTGIDADICGDLRDALRR